MLTRNLEYPTNMDLRNLTHLIARIEMVLEQNQRQGKDIQQQAVKVLNDAVMLDEGQLVRDTLKDLFPFEKGM